jgi:hypothetical protein
MMFTLVGIGTLFMPWMSVPVETFGQFGVDTKWVIRNALASWHGIATAITFLVLFLMLVATSPLYPVPLWRAIILFTVSILLVLFPALFIGMYANLRPYQGQYGAYVALALGFIILFIAALEIRGMFVRLQARRQGTEGYRRDGSRPLVPDKLDRGEREPGPDAWRPKVEEHFREPSQPPGGELESRPSD